MIFKKHSFFLLIFLLLFANSACLSQEKNSFADSIIKEVIIHNTVNKPNKIKFSAYEKLIVTANPDSIEGRIDSVFKIKRKRKIFLKIDSSDYVFKKLIEKQHLYQTEKISEYKIFNNNVKETIFTTRMAGFKVPFFEYFSLQLQPFSVYDSKYSLVEKDYFSPISKKGFKKYNYTFIEDVLIQNRKVHKIYFQTKDRIKNNNLVGHIYIDSEKFSIAKAELNVFGILNVKSTHEFTFNQEFNNWLLVKKTLSIKKGTNKSPIKIFGETITFENINGLSSDNDEKYASDFIEVKSTTNYFEPKFNVLEKIKQPHVSIEIKKSAIAKKENIWYAKFNDSLDIRSNPTYVSLDSMAQKRKIENKIRIGRKVIKGYYPLSFFDVDLRYIIRYNNYEGFRLGMGGVTNEKLSKIYKLEGYYVYGTKDGVFKGLLSNSLRFGNISQSWIGASYQDDVKEIGSTSFEVDKRVFKIYDPRPFNISTFYNHITWRGFIETKIIPKTESIWQISQSNVTPKFDYQFLNNNVVYSTFKTTLLTASLQWNPLSKYMQTPNGRIEIDKKFPKFTFQFSKTISKLGKNDFDFGKIDFRFDYQKKFNSNHKLMFLFEAGYATGDIPLTHLYNHSPNSITKPKILQRMTFGAKDSFETMYFNEFFSNKYVFLQLEYQFPKWKMTKKIKPIFSLVSRFGWGELENKEKHQKIDFKTLESGYLESGFEINNIFKGLGLSTFYRYGPNGLSNFEDNIAIKLSFQLDLGFNN